jgi:hypothetical protein
MSIPTFTAENSLYRTGQIYKLNIDRSVAPNGNEVIPQRDPMGPPEGSSGWRCGPYSWTVDQFGFQTCKKYCCFQDPFGQFTGCGTYECWQNMGSRPLFWRSLSTTLAIRHLL